jgi:hypothetical protein
LEVLLDLELGESPEALSGFSLVASDFVELFSDFFARSAFVEVALEASCDVDEDEDPEALVEVLGVVALEAGFLMGVPIGLIVDRAVADADGVDSETDPLGEALTVAPTEAAGLAVA